MAERLGWSTAAHHMAAREQEDGGRGQGQYISFAGHEPSYLLPPTRPHFLKFPPPSDSPLSHRSINRLIH
jgi:hypothetical protein